MVGKYETGLVDPSVAFIYHVARAIDLDQEQEIAMVNACILDLAHRFSRRYLELARQAAPRDR